MLTKPVYFCRMNVVYLLLGSNEGDRRLWLGKALNAIRSIGTITRQSSFYETAAWGLQEQPDFLNMVIEADTELTPEQTLHRIQQIEQHLGRQRHTPWGQRTLDIDILLYNDEIIETDKLKIPHPYMVERRFTLEPLCEIAGSVIHPVLHRSMYQLLQDCKDMLPVKKVL